MVAHTAEQPAIAEMVDSPHNGITLCTGSLGENTQSDVPPLIRYSAGRDRALGVSYLNGLWEALEKGVARAA